MVTSWAVVDLPTPPGPSMVISIPGSRSQPVAGVVVCSYGHQRQQPPLGRGDRADLGVDRADAFPGGDDRRGGRSS